MSYDFVASTGWIRLVSVFLFASIAFFTTANGKADQSPYNVRGFGAKGDGKAIDTASINRAIETAAAAGGGTVYFLRIFHSTCKRNRDE